MLKHSVQIELFLILWVTKLIYNESPMYTVLDKDTIKNEILPHLSKAKRGYVTQSCLIEVVNAILYKLKTGCQWAFLPVEALFSGKVLSYGAVYHHYNKWSKSGEWKSMWVRLLDKHRNELDMSSVDLDGSHTATLCGGEEVGYQGRKKPEDDCVKKRSSQTSASINGEKMPMTSLLMMNCMLKGIPLNGPTLGWTVSGRY